METRQMGANETLPTSIGNVCKIRPVTNGGGRQKIFDGRIDCRLPSFREVVVRVG